MKKKTFDLGLVYETPVISMVTLTVENVLCTSGTLEQFTLLEDEAGWDI